MLQARFFHHGQVLGVLQVWIVTPVARETDCIRPCLLTTLRCNVASHKLPVFTEFMKSFDEASMLFRQPDFCSLEPGAGQGICRGNFEMAATILDLLRFLRRISLSYGPLLVCLLVAALLISLA